MLLKKNPNFKLILWEKEDAVIPQHPSRGSRGGWGSTPTFHRPTSLSHEWDVSFVYRYKHEVGRADPWGSLQPGNRRWQVRKSEPGNVGNRSGLAVFHLAPAEWNPHLPDGNSSARLGFHPPGVLCPAPFSQKFPPGARAPPPLLTSRNSARPRSPTSLRHS